MFYFVNDSVRLISFVAASRKYSSALINIRRFFFSLSRVSVYKRFYSIVLYKYRRAAFLDRYRRLWTADASAKKSNTQLKVRPGARFVYADGLSSWSGLFIAVEQRRRRRQ